MASMIIWVFESMSMYHWVAVDRSPDGLSEKLAAERGEKVDNLQVVGPNLKL